MGVRVYKLAKEFGLNSKDLIESLSKLHIQVKGHMSSIDDETAQILRYELKTQKKPLKKAEEVQLKELLVRMPITVRDLSVQLHISVNVLLKKILGMNVIANINKILEDSVAVKVSKEFGYNLKNKPTEEEILLSQHKLNDQQNKVLRPPVVTFMGHVDHGKTSLLDIIRKSNITVKESGGITQHIGAYNVELKGKMITFLDTPGHEAFTAMRARGANITDIVVLVVAADDGIMPQTVEAINHAKAAGVPIVVAINKIDLPHTDVDNVKRQLAKLGLNSEDWGGNTITVPVSAKNGLGIKHLLEMILLEAELLELKANPNGPALGVVIENKLSKGSGPTPTILVQNGTLHIGDFFVCGLTYGKVRALLNDWGGRVKSAGPSMPIEVFGVSQLPQIGDEFFVVQDEKKAKELSLQKNKIFREQQLMPDQKMNLGQLLQKTEEGAQELVIILKADVHGSLEAIMDSLTSLSTEEIKLNIIHSQVGPINESDVMLALASNAVIIGFHVGIETKAKEKTEQKKIEVRIYKIIYELINDVRMSMEGMLKPILKEIFIGRGKVLQVFNLSKKNKIAGCVVEKGKFIRTAELVRLFRGDDCLYEGRIDSLRRHKDNVKEIGEGSECGLSLDSFAKIEPDDRIECYHIETISRKL
ncbi:MAG: translation initiation factor IF-2 [Candidatus Omnitrophota bacterium]|nr:MAG: translation initiation factor IF-2 [Candidatus Omnitrophota bacterium]